MAGQPLAQQHTDQGGADQGQSSPSKHRDRPARLGREQQCGQLSLVTEFSKKHRREGGS